MGDEMKKIAMGVLVFARPVHTALTLAYALVNKSPATDLHIFLGACKGNTPSPGVESMCKYLVDNDLASLSYLPEEYPRNTGGNVDNLMLTLSDMGGTYDCFMKIDDDVIIGVGTDQRLAHVITHPDAIKEKVMILVGQVFRSQKSPFVWTSVIDNNHIGYRNNPAPMETYSTFSYDFLPLLKSKGESVRCDVDIGSFRRYAPRVIRSGGKPCTLISPELCMQHIGLTSTITATPSIRDWSPARPWSPANAIIQVPGFNFAEWERADRNGTIKDYGLLVIEGLYEKHGTPALRGILNILNDYDPGVNDVPLPMPKNKLKEIEQQPRQKLSRPRRLPSAVNRSIIKVARNDKSHTNITVK